MEGGHNVPPPPPQCYRALKSPVLIGLTRNVTSCEKIPNELLLLIAEENVQSPTEIFSSVGFSLSRNFEAEKFIPSSSSIFDKNQVSVALRYVFKIFL